LTIWRPSSGVNTICARDGTHEDKRAKRKAMAALEAMTQVDSGKILDRSEA